MKLLTSKRILSVFASLLVIIMFVMTATSCGGNATGKTEPTTDPATSPVTDPITEAPTSYTVIWNVGDEVITSDVVPGEIPVYPNGTPSKEANSEHAYRFTGWNTEIVPASADVAYTAVFEEVASVPVRWILKTGVVTTYHAVGETPTFKGSTDYEGDAQYGYTFKEWKPAVSPIQEGDSKVAYTAYYTSFTKSYNVTFSVNGTVVQENEVSYGVTANYTGSEPKKDGWSFAGWDPPLSKTVGDVSYNAIFGKPDANGYYANLSPDMLTDALNTLTLMTVAYDLGNGQKTLPYNTMSACAYLLIQEHYNPGSVTIQNAVKRQLEALVSGGKEPSMDSGAQWSFAQCAATITLSKATPSIWNSLSSEVQGKLDLLMRCFVITDNFGQNDSNNYSTTLILAGNYNKGWNPNYRFTSLMPMLYAASFFGGADEVDAVLAAFNYDSYIAELTAAGFTNILDVWRRGGDDMKRQLMENGGTAYLLVDSSVDKKTAGSAIGSGTGCRTPFLYQGNRLTREGIAAIFTYTMNFNYGGGLVRSSLPAGAAEPLAYIPGGQISPVEGLDGLLTEFNGGDGGGLRSSLGYSQADFVLGMTGFGTLICLDLLDPVNELSTELKNKIWVGNTDFLFKCTTGYHDFEKGKGSDVTVSGYGGLYYVRDLWNSFIVDLCPYDESIVGYLVKYTVNGQTTSVMYDNPTFTLDNSLLPIGMVWTDGTFFFPGGSSYTMEAKGVLNLSTINGPSDIEPGAYLITEHGRSVAPSSATSDGSYGVEVKNTLLRGRILLELTLSATPGMELPSSFSVQYKHIGAANPASGLLSYSNGKLYAVDNTEICALTKDQSASVAISIDTETGNIKIWLLTKDGYLPITAFNQPNAEKTAGRFCYIYVSKSNYGTSVDFHVKAYWGCPSPVSYAIVGGTDTYDYNVIYKVGDDMHIVGSDSATVTLDKTEYLPEGYIWKEGDSTFYAGGSSYTFSVTGKKTFVAIPGTSEIDATGGKVMEPKTSFSLSVTSDGGDATKQAAFDPVAARISIDVTLTIPTGSNIPAGFAIQYKHLNAPNPATWILRIIQDAETGDYWYADENQNKLVKVQINVPERFTVAYDTTTGRVAIWHYENDKFVLVSDLLVGNAEGTVGRWKYFYMPKSAAPATINIQSIFYRGVFGPIGTEIGTRSE